MISVHLMIAQYPLEAKVWSRQDLQLHSHRVFMLGLLYVQGLPSRISIDVEVGVIDSDYQGEIKVILFNHSTKDFVVKAGDQMAQLILEWIEIPKVQKAVALDNTNQLFPQLCYSMNTKHNAQHVRLSLEKELDKVCNRLGH